MDVQGEGASGPMDCTAKEPGIANQHLHSTGQDGDRVVPAGYLPENRKPTTGSTNEVTGADGSCPKSELDSAAKSVDGRTDSLTRHHADGVAILVVSVQDGATADNAHEEQRTSVADGGCSGAGAPADSPSAEGAAPEDIAAASDLQWQAMPTSAAAHQVPDHVSADSPAEVEENEEADQQGYMPSEGFDSDGSETAAVYDVSQGNINAVSCGGANHVNRRLRSSRARRRLSSSTTSSDSSDDSGDSSNSSRSSSGSSSSSASAVGVDDHAGDSDDADVAHADRAGAYHHAVANAAGKVGQHLRSCPLVRELQGREEGLRHGCIPLSFAHHMMGSVNFAQRLQLYGKLEYHDGCVNTATFNATGTLLASGSDDLNVAVWDWQRKRALLHFESGHHNNVFQSKFMVHSDDTQIVTSARDGQVRLAELSTTGVCRSTRHLAQHRGAAHKIAIEAEAGHTLLSAGEDGVTFQIDLREEKPTRLLCVKADGRKLPLYSIDKNPCDPYEFIVSGHDQYMRVYDKRKITNDDGGGVPVKKFCPHALLNAESRDKANVTCCVYSYDGSEILGTYNDDDIYLFDNAHSDGADYVHSYRGHRNSATVKGVNFYGPRSEFVVSGSDCGNIFLWDKKSEQVVQFMPGDDSGVVNVLEPHPTFAVLATSGLDHDVKLWMPTASASLNLESLAKVMRKNEKERKKEKQRQPQTIDGHTLWMIMQNIRRSARRTERRMENDGEAGQDGSSDDSSDDESDLPFHAPSCTTS